MAEHLSTRTYFLRLAVVAAVYALITYLGLFLVPAEGSGASLIWPSAAIGVAALYFWGYGMWPAVMLSFFALLLSRDTLPPLAAAVALANTLESLIVVYLLRTMSFSPLLSRLRDSVGLMFSAFLGSFVSSTTIATAVLLFGDAALPFNTTLWVGLWVGHTVSILTFAPFALRWLARPLFRKTKIELIEGTVVFGTLTALTYLIYWTPNGSVGNISLIYIAVLFYIWASLRTGPRGIALALALTGVIAATGVLFGHGPISQSPNLANVLFGIQVLIGTLSVIFLLFTSITEERKDAVINLEHHVGQLESALERIRSEDQAKSDFIAILAHELRNPLSPILSGLEILKSRNSGPQDVVRMMGAHVHTIARLLDDLLDIARITQKKFKLERSPVEIKTVIDHALEMVAPQIEERKHTLTVTRPNEDIWLNADPVRLTQVLANILGNAAKYTSPGGTITLHASRDGEYATIRIIDNGNGIAPERLPRIFDAFGGTEGPSKRSSGLRIGLSLAKRMTELHNGTIEAKSNGEGKGSEFIVRLPITPVQMPLESTVPPKRARYSPQELQNLASNGALRILVCDDNQGAAQTLTKLLENNGHEVSIAYSGAEALARAKENPPRVALLDIGLPDMDGYALAHRLKAEHPAIVMVALTGYGQEEDKQKARTAGFAEHMVKPVSIVDVERVLSDLGVHK